MKTFLVLFTVAMISGCAIPPYQAGYVIPADQAPIGKVCYGNGWECYPIYAPIRPPSEGMTYPAYYYRPYAPPAVFYWYHR